MIDFDTETTGLQPYSTKQEAFLYIFSDGTETVTLKAEQRDEIQSWFDRAKEEGIRAWNVKFDRAWAERAGFDIPGDGMWHDGAIYAHVLDEHNPIGLKDVATRLLGPEAVKPADELQEWFKVENRRRRKEAKENETEYVPANYSEIPDELILPYARADVDIMREVSEQQSWFVQEGKLDGVVEFEHRTLDALYAVEKRGIPADREGYVHLQKEVTENVEQLQKRLRLLSPEDDFNPRSTQQIAKALEARGADMSVLKKTAKGEYSTDSDSLRFIDDELAAAILDYRAENKVLNTYITPMIERHYYSPMKCFKEPYIAPDGRIHANYRSVGARTGRMSCTDPNIQNQPRSDLRLRYNVRAEPGHKLVIADLANIEMMLFAAFCGPGKLWDAANSGRDMHQLTTELLGFEDIYRPGGHIITARDRGKTFNFSKIYGGGMRTVMKAQRVDAKEARRLIARFNEVYPEVPQLTDRIERKLNDQGYIEDLLISGRRFRVDPDQAYKGVNYLVQGTAAALLKEALFKLYQDDVPVVALVHDEIVAHVPEADCESVGRQIVDRLTDFPNIQERVPLTAEYDIVERWSEAKDPDFKPRWTKINS